MKLWIQDKLFELHLLIIALFEHLRTMFGKINAYFIKRKIHNYGSIKIHLWQIKFFKCVHAMDVYVITGIYDALMRDKSLQYTNLGINKKTSDKICKILKSNYRYSEQTMFEKSAYNDGLIERTWQNYMPMIVVTKDNNIVWSTERITKIYTKGE